MTRVLVVAGDGLNCERETAEACRAAGLEVDVRWLSDLTADAFDHASLCRSYRAVILPGGFSLGDAWDAGRLLAWNLRRRLGWDLRAFARDGGYVLGICNGMQALVHLGVFGGDVSITANADGRFLDRWVTLEVADDRGWLAGLARLPLPIRHGEGRLVVRAGAAIDGDVRVALRYADDVNGSWQRAAGLSAVDGRILGLMPHPEAACWQFQTPTWTATPATAMMAGPGRALFDNLARALAVGGEGHT